MSGAVLVTLLMSCAPDGESIESERLLLSPREQLLRVSVELRGVHPSEIDLAAIEATPELYEDFVDRYLEDPRFIERVREVFNQRYLTRTSATYGRMADGATGAQVADAIGDEPLRLLSYIVENDLPYSELVLAPYTVASPLLAEVWGLEREPGEGWTLAHYTDGRPEAGILTMNGIWSRYPSMGGNANRHRANAMSKMLLCDDYLVRPIVLSRAAVDQLTIDPELAISENDTC
ncbi:MAG: hypothetical protein ACI8S6_002577, partial [Myxococcota bacterium]